jgi:hypothetical protein
MTGDAAVPTGKIRIDLPALATRAGGDTAWRPPTVTAVAGAVVCALAAWVSLGVMAVADGASSPRLGFLPAWWVPVASGAVLLALACWNRVPTQAWRPTLIPSVLLLPWLPFHVPAAFLLWTGPITAFVWTGTALAVGIAASTGAGRSFRFAAEPRRAAWVAFGASLVVYAVTAWMSAGLRPIGDEPHYLIIAQSLVLDGDIQIENNHKRDDYVPYYSGNLRPDYLRRGKNGQIYSIHAPGLPIIVAPAFALGGYPAVVVFLVLVSAFGAWLVWRTAFALTASVAGAWFGWAAVCLSVPFVCHSGAVFPDGPGAVLVMTGIAALVRLESVGTTSPTCVGGGSGFLPRERFLLFLHGLALALLPWLHTRFAAAAGVVGACIALRLFGKRRFADLAAFAIGPIVSAAAWFGFFYVVYGSFSPASPYRSYSQSSLSNLWPGLPALLLDQQYGVVPNAPVYAIALGGLALLFRQRVRLAIELAILLVVYLAAVASYGMWWGGWSAPARFAVPVLLALGPCAAVFWQRGSTLLRTGALVSLALSLMTAAVFATIDGGRLMLNARDGVTRWLEWLCPVVDLPRALPSFFWGGATGALGDAAVWVAVLLAAWLALGRLLAGGRASNRDRRAILPTAAPLLFMAAVMTASTIVWTAHDVVPVTATSGQLSLMSAFDPESMPTGVLFRPLRIRPAAELVTRLRVSVSERRPRGNNAPLLSIRELPAGTYRLLRAVPGVPRNLQVRIFKSPEPLNDCVFEALQPADCVIRLPVKVTEINVVSPAAVRTTAASADHGPPTFPPRALDLQPLEPLPARGRPTPLTATAAARYGQFSAFIFDTLVFLERPGLWVTGGVDAQLVLASDAPRTSMPVLLRNGARPNAIHLRSGEFRLDVSLAPREERIVTLPLDARSRAAFLQVRADQGYRPSETDPGSRDERFLGVWIEIPE